MNFRSYFKYSCFASATAVHLFCESSAIMTKLKPLFSDSVITEISNTTIRSRHNAHFNCAVGHKRRMFSAVVGFILLCCHKTPRHKKSIRKWALWVIHRHLNTSHELILRSPFQARVNLFSADPIVLEMKKLVSIFSLNMSESPN